MAPKDQFVNWLSFGRTFLVAQSKSLVSLTHGGKKSWQKRIYDDRKRFAVSFYVTCFQGNLANIVPTSIVRKAPKP